LYGKNEKNGWQEGDGDVLYFKPEHNFREAAGL
jgi:hypothetical protein